MYARGASPRDLPTVLVSMPKYEVVACLISSIPTTFWCYTFEKKWTPTTSTFYHVPFTTTYLID